MDEQQQMIAAAVVASVLVFAIGIVTWFVRRRREPARLAQMPPPRPKAPRAPQPIEIARLEEQVKTTAGGDACLVLLILGDLLWTLIMAFDNSAIRQAAYGTMLIANNVLFGIGVIVGRRRTYVVTRMEKPGED